MQLEGAGDLGAEYWVPQTIARKRLGNPLDRVASLPLAMLIYSSHSKQGAMLDFPGKQISSPKCSQVCQEEHSCLCVVYACFPWLKPFSPHYHEVGDS